MNWFTKHSLVIYVHQKVTCKSFMTYLKQPIYINDVNPQYSFSGLGDCWYKACFSTLTHYDYSKQWPFISMQEALREITVNSWTLKEWGCFLENSVPWGWRDQWETASPARILGKEWCVLTSWPYSKAMFSLALLSAVMVCISVPGSVQKPEGTDWDKKVIGLNGRKWKLWTRPNTLPTDSTD